MKKQSHLMKEKTLEIVLTAQRVRKRFVLDTDFGRGLLFESIECDVA